MRREFEATNKIDYGSFYWRRLWRIFPPMYAALFLGVVVSLLGITTGKVTFWATFLQAIHFGNYASLAGHSKGFAEGTTVLWSLAIEEHFYLLFPVCAVLLMKRFDPRKQAAILFLACLTILMWRIYLTYAVDVGAKRIYYATDTRIDAILFGCIMGLWNNPALDKPVVTDDKKIKNIVVLSVGVLVASLAYRNPEFRQTFRYTLQALGVAPLFYFAITRPDLKLFKPLENRWLKQIGKLSYSIYLFHWVVTLIIVNQLPGLSDFPTLILAGVFTIAISYLSYIYIEKPSTKLKSRYTKSTDKPNSDATSDTLVAVD